MEPDTKDWTWVLDRPCPECGLDVTAARPTDVPDLLRANVDAWAPVLQRPDVRHRPSPDVWSPLEYACHVRDVCTLYTDRLELMLTHEDPLFPNWDQDETAVVDRYGEQDPAVVADQLQTAGRALAERFAAGPDWTRPGRRSDGANFTLDSFARYFVHDPVHHLWDVTSSRM